MELILVKFDIILSIYYLRAFILYYFPHLYNAILLPSKIKLAFGKEFKFLVWVIELLLLKALELEVQFVHSWNLK